MCVLYEKGVRVCSGSCTPTVWSQFLLHGFWRLNSGIGLVYQMPLPIKTSANLRKVGLTQFLEAENPSLDSRSNLILGDI